MFKFVYFCVENTYFTPSIQRKIPFISKIELTNHAMIRIVPRIILSIALGYLYFRNNNV